MTTFNTSLQHYTPAAGKGIPYDHVLDTFNNTLALKQGDKAFDFLVGLQVDKTDTGTQNNYDPGTGAVVRWNGASQITVTGLVAHLAGDIRLLENITSAQLLTLTNQDAGSTAANRIILASTNALNVPPGGTVALQYDGTAARWRVLFVNCYDDGTFTPTIVSSGGGTPTYTTQAAKYAKRGRQVSYWGRITLATKGTLAAGNVLVGGLPFASDSTATNLGLCQVTFWGGMTTAITTLSGFVQSSDTQISMRYAAGVATGISQLTVADINTTFDIIFGGSYLSAA